MSWLMEARYASSDCLDVFKCTQRLEMKFTNEILGSTKLFALLVLGSIPGILCFASVRFVNMVGMGLNLTPTNNFFTRTSLLCFSLSPFLLSSSSWSDSRLKLNEKMSC